MAILVNDKTRLLVQGLGRDGAFQASLMREYGTNMVAAVHPGRSGQKFEDQVPYFETVADAVAQTGANAGVIFVPAVAAMDAIVEQVDAGLDLTVCITEGVPVLDMVKIKAYLKDKKTRLIGPNCPGLLSPSDKVKIGIIPGGIVKPGTVGVVSRSGTLTYEAIWQIGKYGFGQSTCVGIGGDPVSGTAFVDILALFEQDKDTEAIVLIGEIGGLREQRAAEFIKAHCTKPVIAYIAGVTAPPGKRMGHAGAVITGSAATAESKVQTLRDAGAFVVDSPALIGEQVSRVIGSK